MASVIRLILKEDVDNLGSSGDVVRVRPGYARNFLSPRGLALPATDSNMAQLDELKRLAAARAQKDLEAAEQEKQKIEAISIKLERAVGEENRMYGSVTSKDIAEAYAAQGVELDRKKIELDDPIKDLGPHDVKLRLHAKVSATLRVEVVKKS